MSLAPVSHAFPPAPGTEASRPACAPFSPDLPPGLCEGPPSPDLPAALRGGPLSPAPAAGEEDERWTLGAEEIDQALPGGGLLASGLHEIRPVSYRDPGAALGFALALLGRRLGQTPQTHRPARILWAATDATWREAGRPYGPGLARFGVEPQALLMICTRNARDLAWALEEGVKSRALAAVLGQIETAPPLLARRLALAARDTRTPCLLVPGPKASGLGPVLTRWRVAAAPSGTHAFDPAAPGGPRWHIVLERCRWGRGGQTWTVEWSDDASCFHMVAALADRAAEAGDETEPAVRLVG